MHTSVLDAVDLQYLAPREHAGALHGTNLQGNRWTSLDDLSRVYDRTRPADRLRCSAVGGKVGRDTLLARDDGFEWRGMSVQVTEVQFLVRSPFFMVSCGHPGLCIPLKMS